MIKKRSKALVHWATLLNPGSKTPWAPWCGAQSTDLAKTVEGVTCSLCKMRLAQIQAVGDIAHTRDTPAMLVTP